MQRCTFESRQSVAVAFADSTTHTRKADSIGEAWVDEATTLVQEGNSLWRIARREYGDGTLYTVIFAANQQNIRSPDLILSRTGAYLASRKRVRTNPEFAAEALGRFL